VEMQQRQSRSLYGSSLRGVAALPPTLDYRCRCCRCNTRLHLPRSRLFSSNIPAKRWFVR